MKTTVAILLIILCSFVGFAQKPKPSGKTKPVQTAANSDIEKDALAKAVVIESVTERLAALQKFLKDFPAATEKTRAAELIVSARAQIGEEKLQANEPAAALESFKAAVTDAPVPISEQLFAEVLMRIPTNLFFGGDRAGAIEVAHLIEAKNDTDAKRLIALATFFLGTENADEAERLAEKAITLEPNFATAFQTLGFAYRINFELEKSVTAYTKALELAPDSAAIKRSLAEMKRAVGKSAEALTLYREILANDESDTAAQTGLILSLFDAEKQAEAEAEMSKSLDTAPNNLFLLVGAAYWYAAHRNGDKAVELAQQALAVEPRYTWAYIALARGQIEQKKPLDAEKTLLTARQYGDFPTLDYEIAAARLEAGFYREAADELKKSFLIEDGKVVTRLGYRVKVVAPDFIELLAPERRAGIFQPLAADNPAKARKVKSLLDFTQELEAKDTDETKIVATAENFASGAGDDKMTVHRQLYAAERLLDKNVAPATANKLAQAAVGKVEAALNVPNAAAAVLAEELYASRKIAESRGEIVVTPDVPPRTLAAILRGRIEEITAWSLYRQNKSEEAIIHLKRALGVLPEKSAWWRSSQWRLGIALEAVGKTEDALAAYIKSYNADTGTHLFSQYSIIETLYRKIHGTTEGLEKQVGAKPADLIANSIAATNGADDETTITPTPEPVPETAPSPQIETPTAEKETLESIPKITPEITPETIPNPEPTPALDSTTNKLETETPVTEKKETVAPSPEKTPEAQPTPAENIQTEIVTGTEAKKPPTEKENLTKSETAPEKQPDKESENNPKTLFDPVIIVVPSAAKTNTDKKAIDNPAAKTNEPIVKPESEIAPPESKSNVPDRTGESRQRVIIEKMPGTITSCQIVPSQETLLISNNGGSLGILIAVEGGETGALEKIVPVSSSPNDVAVTLDPQISAESGRLYFIIKSVSKNPGVYSVVFELPCGKKQVEVQVR